MSTGLPGSWSVLESVPTEPSISNRSHLSDSAGREPVCVGLR